MLHQLAITVMNMEHQSKTSWDPTTEQFLTSQRMLRLPIHHLQLLSRPKPMTIHHTKFPQLCNTPINQNTTPTLTPPQSWPRLSQLQSTIINQLPSLRPFQLQSTINPLSTLLTLIKLQSLPTKQLPQLQSTNKLISQHTHIKPLMLTKPQFWPNLSNTLQPSLSHTPASKVSVPTMPGNSSNYKMNDEHFLVI